MYGTGMNISTVYIPTANFEDSKKLLTTIPFCRKCIENIEVMPVGRDYIPLWLISFKILFRRKSTTETDFQGRPASSF